MRKFEVILQSQPEKYYRKADTKTAKVLKMCFRQLEENPFYYPGKIKRLEAKVELFRYTTGDLRVF